MYCRALACSMVWVEGHHSSFPSANEKLTHAELHYPLWDNEFLPAEETLQYCVPDPDLRTLCVCVWGGHFLMSIDTLSHDTKGTQKLERLFCKLCFVKLFEISAPWQGCQLSLAFTQVSGGLNVLDTQLLLLFRAIYSEYIGWVS